MASFSLPLSFVRPGNVGFDVLHPMLILGTEKLYVAFERTLVKILSFFILPELRKAGSKVLIGVLSNTSF